MKRFDMGEEVIFRPKKGKDRKGVIAPGFVDTGMVKVHLDGDPFPVDVKRSQVSSCSVNGNTVKSQKKVPKDGTKKRHKEKKVTDTATKPSAKALRKEAMALGIEGWEDMDREEMAKAIRRAKKAAKNGASVEDGGKSKKSKKGKKGKRNKSEAKAEKPAATKPKASSTKPKATKGKATKKAAASKASATKPAKAAPKGNTEDGLTFAKGSTPKSLPDEGVNPFRRNSNLFVVAGLLLKGGSRRKLAEKLASKVSLHPYQKASDSVDLLDFDKRLLLGAQTMRDQFGYGIQRTGRGLDGTILVFRPGGEKDPRKASKSKAKK